MATRSRITVYTLLSLRERQVGTRDPHLCVGKARFAIQVVGQLYITIFGGQNTICCTGSKTAGEGNGGHNVD